MAAAPKDIFLSYGREPEVSAFVKKLKEDLEKGGFSVWLDNDDIAAGADWYSAIAAALRDCKALVAVVTNKYIKESEHCKNELHNARENKKALFPIIYEEITDDGSANYNEFQLRMGRFNWLYKSKLEYRELLSKLIEGLNKALELESTDGPVEGAGVPVPGATSSQPPSSSSPPTQDSLDIDDKEDVLEALEKHKFATVDWRQLCGKLGVSHNDLSIIEAQHRENVKRQLEEGICYWLGKKINLEKFKNPSWSVLIEALKKINENAVVAGIKKERKILD